VGLKPSRGLVPQGPDNFDAWFGLVTNGILSKSVRDTALVLSHISGPEKGAPYECPSIREQFLPALEQKSEQFKIAYCPTPLLAPSYDDEVEQALHRTVARLKSIGHELVPLDPPVPPKEATQAYLKIFTLGLCQQINGIARQTLRKPKSRYFDPSTWFIYSLGQSLRATDLGEAIQFSRQLSYKLATIYERFDFLLTPTACSVPVKNGLSQLHPWEKIGSKILASIGSRHLMWPVFKALAQKGMAASGSTQLANLAGHPALSLPLEQASDGMPIGMQFMAPFAHDAKLIALGSKLERDIPWKKAEVSVKFP
jgi:amidase